MRRAELFSELTAESMLKSFPKMAGDGATGNGLPCDGTPEALIRRAAWAADSPRAVFTPLHYEPNYAYPLLVWLHGPGDDERQLHRVMPLVSMRNYVAVAPRGTSRIERPNRCSRSGFSGHGWSQEPAHVAMAEQQIFESIDAACDEFNVAAHRIFIGGFDGGGTMAFRMAMCHPTRFAGVLSLGGRFPLHGAPLRRLNEARRVRVFLACGRKSATLLPERTCQDLRLFHSAGMEVVLRQYPCGHEITSDMLADMDRWMMEYVVSGGDRDAANSRSR